MFIYSFIIVYHVIISEINHITFFVKCRKKIQNAIKFKIGSNWVGRFILFASTKLIILIKIFIFIFLKL